MQNFIFLFSELLDSAGVIKSNPPRYRKVEVVCVYLLENKNYMNVIVFFCILLLQLAVANWSSYFINLKIYLVMIYIFEMMANKDSHPSIHSSILPIIDPSIHPSNHTYTHTYKCKYIVTYLHTFWGWRTGPRGCLIIGVLNHIWKGFVAEIMT